MRSAKRAAEARARSRREEDTRQEEENKKSEKYERRVMRAARKLAPSLYREYKSAINKAASSGETSCAVDYKDWSWSADDESRATDGEVFESNVKLEAQKIAQKKLKDEGYMLEPKSQTSSTTLGSGSDPYTTGESGSSWLEISFSPKKKR